MGVGNEYSAGDLTFSIGQVGDNVLQTLDAIIVRLNQISPALNSISKTAIATNKNTGGDKNRKNRNYGKDLFNVAKLTTAFFLARRIGQAVGSIAQSGADYTETLNLWETSMGNNLSIATEFVNKMNQAYGISEKTLMNAQAIFKNMLGSLGQISDTMAYALSEGVTQMALDYASLYNVTFEKAFTKFQAALAGQVRPIRSVSGYDITENTLYQLYQSLGGTKTMRQLSRTEKQLLSILAIFNQMTASGAVGDLDKTMNSFANQSRVMAESWQQVKTYAGVLLTHLIQESGILVKINAVLIFMGDVLKALAEQMGAIEHFGGDIFGDVEVSAENAGKEVDKLKGKLFEFDKFRALNSGDDEDVAIDDKVLSALSKYETILGNASMQARKLADEWLKIIGFTYDANGKLTITDERLQTIKIVLGAIAGIIAVILGFSIIASLVRFGKALYTYAIVPVKEFFVLLAVKSKSAIETWILHLMEAMGAGNTFSLAVASMTGAMLGLSASVVGALLLIQNWGDMNTWQKIVGGIGLATTAFFGLALAVGAFHSAWSMGVAAAGIATGIAAIIASIATIKKEANIPVTYYANGGLPEKGSMFLAGESGAEIVYNSPNGQSGVVNVNQISQAMYNALVRYGRSQDNKGQPLIVLLDGEVVYQNTTAKAKAHGNIWSKA